MNPAQRPRLAITTGEPAGIGPEIALAALAAGDFLARCRPVLLGDGRMLAARARALGIALPLIAYDPEREPAQGAVEVCNIPLAEPALPGQLNPGNVAALLDTLDRAIDGAVAGEFAAIVTAPLQKSVINHAGVVFSGHTEYLAERTGTARVVMMLAGGGMRVALATTHLPLAAVSAAINASMLEDTLRILAGDLKRWFGVSRPRILVAGLNPHAGEDGVLGREDIDIIAPTLERLRLCGMNLVGPLPADTLFQPHRLKDADAVLAMYHDQGLPVLKYASFGHGVNITLGLPIIRTSVDHGTALDLAGSGRADAGSMQMALATALAMHEAREAAR